LCRLPFWQAAAHHASAMLHVSSDALLQTGTRQCRLPGGWLLAMSIAPADRVNGSKPDSCSIWKWAAHASNAASMPVMALTWPVCFPMGQGELRQCSAATV